MRIDDDGAGFGWFLDATPLDDLEFASNDGDRPAGIDLLTVVMHELGHVVGLDDHYSADGSDDLMHGYLDAGERRVPGGDTGAAVLSADQAEWGDMALHHFKLPEYHSDPWL